MYTRLRFIELHSVRLIINHENVVKQFFCCISLRLGTEKLCRLKTARSITLRILRQPLSKMHAFIMTDGYLPSSLCLHFAFSVNWFKMQIRAIEKRFNLFKVRTETPKSKRPSPVIGKVYEIRHANRKDGEGLWVWSYSVIIYLQLVRARLLVRL